MIQIVIFYAFLPFCYDGNAELTDRSFRVRESAWKRLSPVFLASCRSDDPDFVHRQSKVDWHSRFAVTFTVPFDAAWSVIKQSKLVGVNQGWGTFILNDVQQFAVNHTNYDELWSMHGYCFPRHFGREYGCDRVHLWYDFLELNRKSNLVDK